MLKNLMDSPVAWAILAILSIFSVLFAIYEYFKNRKFKELVYSKSNFSVVENGEKSMSKIAIMYDGEEVDNVAVSKFAIWNNGTESIEKSHFVPEQNIKIKAKNGAKILDVRIIGVTDEDNKFSVTLDSESMATVDFDYAAHKDGCVIQLVHTGGKSDISINCKLKEGKKLKKSNSSDWDIVFELFSAGVFESKKANRIISVVFLSVFALICSLVALSFFLEKLGIKESNMFNFGDVHDSFLTALMIMMEFTGIVSYVILFAFIIKPKVPRKLRPYIEDSSKYYN